MVVRLPSNGCITSGKRVGSTPSGELLIPRRGLPIQPPPPKFLAADGRLARNSEQPARFEMQLFAIEPVSVRPG